KHSDTWKEAIADWRKPILGDSGFPEPLKMALFNELYLLADGGTLWTAGMENDPIGQFGVLECLDYRWYESLDVRLYGGFALTRLWPKLEKAVMLAFARAIPQGDNTPRIIGYNQAQAVRKIASATPHDLGAPNEHPWDKTNYTSYQDCNLWKDLGCDFVLQVYRYFLWTGAEDLEFLQECWFALVETLDYLKTFDQDGDGIPENSGAPDQTFDDWQLKGISAYCGGLWLAALEGAIAIGQHLQNAQDSPDPNLQAQIEQWSTWLDQSKPLYQKTLWNGAYYNLDSQSRSQVVMADQLCGQFYAQLLNLPPIVPADCTITTLQTIYHTCFTQFNQIQNPDRAALGVANGVNLDGSPENPKATHPLEIWTGINFGLAAFMLQQGMKAEAFTIAEAVVNQIYTHGLQFRTPEAITAARTFRASHYLRAMAIWGLYQVWVMGHQQTS
ncbi:MAG: bile acid beta-glucosidase, partial [Roseofilum sp. SID2]